MSSPDHAVVFRPYEVEDHDEVAALWTRINRELAPPHLRERFEHYIATALLDELRQIQDVFTKANRSAFWVVEIDGAVAGTFGIQGHDEARVELRRMYVDRNHRGGGIAQRMLRHAEDQARAFGFSTMILSTAELQKAAISFYSKSAYRLVKTEVADDMSTKTVGGGMVRFHFEKDL